MRTCYKIFKIAYSSPSSHVQSERIGPTNGSSRRPGLRPARGLTWALGAHMQSIIVPLLVSIAEAMSPVAYLKAQDNALLIAASHVEDLRREAANNPESALRMEALGLVELLGGPDSEAFLLDRLRSDPDAQVAEHAKALLFRATIAKNARTSGQMSETQYQTYRATSRQLSAEALFRPVAPAPDTKQ